MKNRKAPQMDRSQIPRLKSLTVRARPLTCHALSWSSDAELAVATDEAVHVFIPEFPKAACAGEDKGPLGVSLPLLSCPARGHRPRPATCSTSGRYHHWPWCACSPLVSRPAAFTGLCDWHACRASPGGQAAKEAWQRGRLSA